MTDTAPPRPIFALTVAVAGKRVIPDDARPDLAGGLTLAFDALAARRFGAGRHGAQGGRSAGRAVR